MHLTLQSPRPFSLHVFLTRAGYHRSRDGESYARRAGPHEYPRFHLYSQAESCVVTLHPRTSHADGVPVRGSLPVRQAGAQGVRLSLHLDQKAASYEGTRRHSGEYDGAVVEAEAERLTNLASRFGT